MASTKRNLRALSNLTIILPKENNGFVPSISPIAQEVSPLPSSVHDLGKVGVEHEDTKETVFLNKVTDSEKGDGSKVTSNSDGVRGEFNDVELQKTDFEKVKEILRTIESQQSADVDKALDTVGDDEANYTDNPDTTGNLDKEKDPIEEVTPKRTTSGESVHPKKQLRGQRSEGRLAALVSDIAFSQSLVQLLRDPTVFNFTRLRQKLKSDDRRWMSGFLKLGGLEMLFEGLRSFGSYSGSFSNLIQRLECVMCIKTVMNSQIGMQTITSSGKVK
ncbi:INF2-like protein [Mya arenaria]|uniref:INF2-like protein n=1 Tax=Mya arenaria TaxID=6604 RepID=A0ABY7DM40_MYAAR|nr:INF2-like protein [Mya arenaria]